MISEVKFDKSGMKAKIGEYKVGRLELPINKLKSIGITVDTPDMEIEFVGIKTIVRSASLTDSEKNKRKVQFMQRNGKVIYARLLIPDLILRQMSLNENNSQVRVVFSKDEITIRAVRRNEENIFFSAREFSEITGIDRRALKGYEEKGLLTSEWRRGKKVYTIKQVKKALKLIDNRS